MSTTGQLHEQDFNDWWARTGEWVEAPNQRRGGESGVQILVPESPEQPWLYSKRQIGHRFISLRYPLGRPTVLREKNAMHALEALGVRVPKLIFYGAVKKGPDWHALLVTQALTGFISLDEWYEQQRSQPVDSALIEPVLQHVATTLYKMHRAGWQHSCCYGKHIFIKINAKHAPEVALLDLEKARRRWPAQRAALHDIKQLSRHRGGMPEAHWQLFLQHYCNLNPKLRTKLP
ncbi:MAG: lipopolysaccharide kinase InaA family protein [Pseudomonas sp.]|nr:lipopolysaccharide kinase InaA family protein [Pseudomonas sp.]